MEILGNKAEGACEQRRESYSVVEKWVIFLGSTTQFKESVSFKYKVEYRGGNSISFWYDTWQEEPL